MEHRASHACHCCVHSLCCWLGPGGAEGTQFVQPQLEVMQPAPGSQHHAALLTSRVAQGSCSRSQVPEAKSVLLVGAPNPIRLGIIQLVLGTS